MDPRGVRCGARPAERDPARLRFRALLGGRDAVELVPGDSQEAVWRTDIDDLVPLVSADRSSQHIIAEGRPHRRAWWATLAVTPLSPLRNASS